MKRRIETGCPDGSLEALTLAKDQPCVNLALKRVDDVAHCVSDDSRDAGGKDKDQLRMVPCIDCSYRLTQPLLSPMDNFIFRQRSREPTFGTNGARAACSLAKAIEYVHGRRAAYTAHRSVYDQCR